MNILVLDSIHGGDALARHLSGLKHTVDLVDVYRGEKGIPVESALEKNYDLIVAPVHLDPDHPLMQIEGTPRISHHEAVGLILEGRTPHPMIEITGTRGKTTTAYAIAQLMNNAGVLHTSEATREFPGGKRLWKKSITPASVIEAALHAYVCGGWLVAEESLGVTGIGEIGVLTSADDYPIANGRRSALAEKVRLLSLCEHIVAPRGVRFSSENVTYVEDMTEVSGTRCRYSYNGIEGEFHNDLLSLKGYRHALMTAATVACLLSLDPAPLSGFRALEGRMSTVWKNGILVVDNANSGTNASNAVEAARHARRLARTGELTLVIGTEAQNICEGFPVKDILHAIQIIRPTRVIAVGFEGGQVGDLLQDDCPVLEASDLKDGHEKAQSLTGGGSIVLAVKTWR